MTLLRGIDVSKYQGERIDWEAVRNGGFSFAWIKATEGATYTDPRFAANWAGSLYGGLQRGAYHYLSPHSSGEDQAKHFLDVYPGDGELPPALGVEETGEHQTGIELVTNVVSWLITVECALGVRPIVYTFPSFADDHFGPVPAASIFKRNKLWLAHHDVDAPRTPWPWDDWHAWQTGKGHVAGIRGQVDLNVMR